VLYLIKNMKQKEAHRLNNNWTYVKQVWKKKQQEHNLLGWVLMKEDMNDKIGLCVYHEKKIVLSTIFMRGANCNYKKVKEALMHEIAHALTPGHNHDHVWKAMCLKIGGDGEITGFMDLPGMNWSVYCHGCKQRNEYYAYPDMTNKVCARCYSKPVVKPIL